ncbi:MAG: lysylphosphatidylglycerol synthase domain-containing protein [Actinomycetota bacterium]|nr:flippase-like domain-containing protein [Thermoleophilia bacterium]MDA3005250.1 lysylphosphatidylglycerol synthase domain-containing protein [Actinomycetota bacterium]
MAHLTRFIPHRVKGKHFDPSAWRHMDRSALKHLLGRVITYAIFLLIIFGILKLVPRIWQDVREGDPLYVALAVPMEILSVGGYVVLFWAVYGAAARMGTAHDADTPARPLSLKESMQLTTSRLALGDTLPGGGATGFAVQFWALARAGFTAAQISRTTTAFLVLSNTVMTVMIMVLGVLIGAGLVAGDLHPALTWIPAAIAAAVVGVILGFAWKGRTFVPPDPDSRPALTGRFAKLRTTLRDIGDRLPPGAYDAMRIIRRPAAIGGMVTNPGFDFVAFYLGIAAVTEPIALPVMLMAYFIGQVGSLIPLPGGIGGVQGLAIGVLVAGGMEVHSATAGVLVWTGVALGTQIVWGLWQYWFLRKSIKRWQAEDAATPVSGT